jgi:hypothetical protein
MEGFVLTFLRLTNETLTAAIVVVAASMLLYNLTRNLRNRVARTSAIVLACVTVVYLGDVFISLGPSSRTFESALRAQWIGIAFMPAAMFHLSDALLATTGLPSRGRRRRVIRILYLISAVLLMLAAFSNLLIVPVRMGSVVKLQAGPLFPIYLLHFAIAIGVAFINVQRARQRCLTRDTRRRMGYLQIAMLTPAVGVFPFSVFMGNGEEYELAGLVLVNVTNLVIILMLLFLAYPLSFFGSNVPDRVVKSELLRFVLRGPGTALLALAIIIFISPINQILSLPGGDLVPFAVVAVVLLWQWGVHLALPWFERTLIYSGEDSDHLEKLQDLSERLLTRADLLQLLEAILAASCDYLQVNTAFVISFVEGETTLTAAIGPSRPTQSWLEEETPTLKNLLNAVDRDTLLVIQKWHSYWIVPLYSKRMDDSSGQPTMIGFMGIQARSPEVDLDADERQMFQTFVRRAAQTLDDLALQSEIYAALEGLLPQIITTRTRAAEVEYRPGRDPKNDNGFIEREQFVEQVRAALRHYWGGPGLTSSRLIELNIVQHAMQANDNNPTRALRSVLHDAIEQQRPEGEQKMTSPEWTIYNILDLRFVERLKVRDVVIRLAMSEPDLYRKQRVAIEAVADTLLDMEHGNGTSDDTASGM